MYNWIFSPPSENPHFIRGGISPRRPLFRSLIIALVVVNSLVLVICRDAVVRADMVPVGVHDVSKPTPESPVSLIAVLYRGIKIPSLTPATRRELRSIYPFWQMSGR